MCIFKNWYLWPFSYNFDGQGWIVVGKYFYLYCPQIHVAKIISSSPKKGFSHYLGYVQYMLENVVFSLRMLYIKVKLINDDLIPIISVQVELKFFFFLIT